MWRLVYLTLEILPWFWKSSLGTLALGVASGRRTAEKSAGSHSQARQLRARTFHGRSGGARPHGGPALWVRKAELPAGDLQVHTVWAPKSPLLHFD